MASSRACVLSDGRGAGSAVELTVPSAAAYLPLRRATSSSSLDRVFRTMWTAIQMRMRPGMAKVMAMTIPDEARWSAYLVGLR